MTLTVEIDPARRTAAFREVSFLAAGDSCRVVLDGVRGADFGSLALLLYRDAASESPVASCPSFSAVEGHPALADGELALDTSEMAAWFEDAVPGESDDSDDALPRASASAEPRLAARASLAERSVRADGWLVVLDRDRTWAACRVPVLLRPAAAGSGATDPTSVRALVEGLESAALEDKADKAPPSAAGNLASLDASGNLLDSGATPASIKAAAVAEVVANAPGTMDTLEEIADILGSTQQTGTVLQRILDLESGKADTSSLARVATSGSYSDLSGRPAIPAAVSVDATLATQGAAADAKAVGDALRSGFTEWEFRGVPEGLTVDLLAYASSSSEWVLSLRPGVTLFADGDEDDTLVVFSGSDYDSGSSYTITATRHLITPTKTSQLTNDGAPNGGGNAYVMTNDPRLTNAREPTAHAHAMADVTGLNAALAQKASLDDLPYRLVEPGKWEITPNTINGGTVSASYEEVDEDYSVWCFRLSNEDPEVSPYAITSDTNANSLHITTVVEDTTITATRASLPGHLLDRSVNAVPVAGATTTITLPEKIDGKSRDFYVRLSVSAESAVMFAATDSGGAAVSWDSMGSPSGTFAAGTYLYRFTEVAAGVFHAADVTNGGSVDPAVLAGKLEATSAAPAFGSTKTYSVGEHVTYNGVLYECSTAVTTAGAWTGSTNWTATNMTTPDATLDLMADGRLRLVSADGEVLWMQGYALAPSSSVSLSCDKVNFYAFASGTVTQAFDMPSAPSGKVGDFVLDVDNTANASASATATLTGAGTAFDVFTPEGVNLSTDILTFAGGEQCELYFTMTAFGTAAKPAWKVVKQIVEKQEFGS